MHPELLRFTLERVILQTNDSEMSLIQHIAGELICNPAKKDLAGFVKKETGDMTLRQKLAICQFVREVRKVVNGMEDYQPDNFFAYIMPCMKDRIHSMECRLAARRYAGRINEIKEKYHRTL